MKKFHIVLNGKSYDAEVEEMGAYPSEMVALSTPTGTSVQKQAPVSMSSSSAFTVKAPLQGNVIGLCVKEGDSIKEGDVFVKIEAMKMENEIAATKTGIVKKVYVSDGTHVNQDDPLIDIA